MRKLLLALTLSVITAVGVSLLFSEYGSMIVSAFFCGVITLLVIICNRLQELRIATQENAAEIKSVQTNTNTEFEKMNKDIENDFDVFARAVSKDFNNMEEFFGSELHNVVLLIANQRYGEDN